MNESDEIDLPQRRPPFNKEYQVYSVCTMKSCAHLDNIIIRIKQFVPIRYRYEFECCLLYTEPRFYTTLCAEHLTGRKYPNGVVQKISDVRVIGPEVYNPAKTQVVALVLEPPAFFIRRNKELKMECNAEEPCSTYLAYVALAHLDRALSTQELEVLKQTFVGMSLEFDNEVHKLVLVKE
jgi:hypothetical protein